MGTGFVKFPRWLLEEPYLSELSGNEKILYSLIADRCELSKSTGKCDEDGKPFAVFTIKSIASISRVVLGKEFSVAVAIFTITNLLFVAIPRLLFLLSAKFPAAIPAT